MTRAGWELAAANRVDRNLGFPLKV